MFQISD